MKTPTSYQTIDGRWVHVVRQSDLNRLRKCAEQHRVHMLGQSTQRTSLAMLVGTAVHAGIEETLRSARGHLMNASEAIDAALSVFEQDLMAAIREGTLSDSPLKEDPYLAVQTCTMAWHEDVLPWLITCNGMDGAVEQRFEVVFFEDADRTVVLQGTADYVLPRMVCDWKTGSGNGSYTRDGWKYRRGYETTQHVVYATAMALLEGNFPETDRDSLRTFRYVRMSRSGNETDVLDINVLPSDVRFLKAECLSLAHLIEAQAKSWQLGSTGWWCAPQWCDHWDKCRGATGGMQK